MDGKIHLHERFRGLFVEIWFGIVFYLAVDVSPGASFVDRFISGIFPSKRKVVRWHSHLVAISVSSEISKSSNPTTAIVNTPIGDTHKLEIEFEKTSTPIRMARKALLQPHTECHVMVITSASGLHTIQPRILEGIRQLTFSANGRIDVVPSQLFYILIYNFFAKVMHLPKHMVLTYAMPRDLRRP